MEHVVSPPACVHTLPGRLRVKLTAIKKAPAVAGQVERALLQEQGVAEAVASPVTGSVLVHYDPERTSLEAILARLAPYGDSTTAPTPGSLSDLSSQIGKVLGKELVKIALAQMLPVGPVEVLFALI